MAEAFDVRELLATLDTAPLPVDDRPKTINDLPNDLLVSVFEAVGDLRWVRHTIPLVCKAWAELYRSQNASPLHGTLVVNFRKEVGRYDDDEEDDDEEEVEEMERPLRRPVVHASRIVSWVERRAGWVRKLDLRGGYSGHSEDFSSEDLSRLVAVVGSSLTEVWIGCDLDELSSAPFWEALRASVVRHGRLRSLVVVGNFAKVSRSDVEPLGQLAGSLEELVLDTLVDDPQEFDEFDSQELEGVEAVLPHFFESFCALTELRRLELHGHLEITAIPAEISSLKKLKDLGLIGNRLSSVPKELGELSGLTSLVLASNMTLGDAPQDEAFPAALGRMKSLRELKLGGCGLRAVPAFVGELESLAVLNLACNRNLGDAPQDEAFPAALGRMKSLRELDLSWCGLRAVPAFVGELESLEDLDLSSNTTLGNALQDEAFPAELGRMKSLRKIDLSECNFLAVPAFVGELESLEDLDLSWNENLGNTTQGEAFPAELGRMKSLRHLNLRSCNFLAVPAFVGELQSLEGLNLSYNQNEIYATLDFLIDGCPRLREVRLKGLHMTPESWAHVEAFEAKLLAQNPNAVVM